MKDKGKYLERAIKSIGTKKLLDVYLTLLELTDANGYITDRQEYICTITNTKKSNLSSYITRLEQLGLLKKYKEREGNYSKNRYLII